MDNNEKPKTRTSSSESSTRSPSTKPRSTITSKTTTRSTSAEDKLKKSMKGLSHMGGVGGGLNLDTSTESKNSTERKKVGGVVLDVGTIQDASKQRLQTKGRRNTVVILVLSLALIISLVYLAVAVLGFLGGKQEPNCKFVVEGEASWVIEGKSKTEFRIPQGLARDMMYVIDASLSIETNESVELHINIKVEHKGQEILIGGLHECNNNLVRVDNTNKFVYQNTITGGGTIKLFEGIDFTEAPYDMTSDTINIVVTAYIVKI